MSAAKPTFKELCEKLDKQLNAVTDQAPGIVDYIGLANDSEGIELIFKHANGQRLRILVAEKSYTVTLQTTQIEPLRKFISDLYSSTK